ncbi:hypothetical protein I5P84_05765 [Pseudomonas mosselii]|uniref:hypothetical protein n=1 Tax=Pseudomonas TaxID=286 RepID=UPI0018D9C4BD|nr:MULTISPECIES: hypothetical protein [Pseudomonas]MBH3308960.1 hypothetical protein [Pseudomonas mosselii]MBH3323985.1 hypothetical protein [Pseudomonas mosselii]
MKIRALGKLSGATGDREKGEEFEVDSKRGADLVARGYAEEVTKVAGTSGKPDKAKE